MIYTIGIAVILKVISQWNSDLLKDAIFWYLFIGFPLIFRFATNENQIRIFKKVFFENFQLILIAEFIINFYTLPLILELILLPILFFLTVSDLILNKKEEFKSIAKFFENLKVFVGFLILTYAVFEVIKNWDSFLNITTLQAFLLPIILTLLYLPFLYFLVLYSNYDSLFNRLEIGADKNRELKWHAKKIIFKNCLFSIRKTQKAKNMNIFNIMSIRTESDINDMDKTYKRKL